MQRDILSVINKNSHIIHKDISLTLIMRLIFSANYIGKVILKIN